jgi:hypothetical protein
MNGRFFNSVQILQACPKSHKPLPDKRNLGFFKSFNLSTGATHARVYRESSIERLKDLNDSYFISIDQTVSCQPSPLNFVEAFESTADVARPRHRAAFGTERVPARCPASRTRCSGRIGRALQPGGLLRLACGGRRAQPSRLGVAPVLEWPTAAPGPCAGHPGRGARHPGSPNRLTAPRSRAGLMSFTARYSLLEQSR